MKKMILILSIGIGFISCNAQESELKNEQHSPQPKESWSVNKKVDENGNITQYDSTYTWSYSNIKGDSMNVNLDSVMNSFESFFNTTYSFGWNEDFSFFPKPDSMLNEEFFNHSYYFDNWNRQQFNIEQMMKQMDSTRNDYLKRYFPGLMESKKDKTDDSIIQ